MAKDAKEKKGVKKEAKKVEEKAPATEVSAENLPFYKRHVIPLQLLCAVCAAGVSLGGLYFNPPDRYRFIDSYRAPNQWYAHFADQYSELFDGWNYTLPNRVSTRLSELHKEAGLPASDARVLDVGVGSGFVGSQLHRSGYRHLVGFDVCPEMVAVANQTKAYEQLTVADAEATPMEGFADSSFDAVLCVGTSGYIARGERAGERDDKGRTPSSMPESSRVRALLLDWLRVLKPGGLLGITVEVSLGAPWEEESGKLTDEQRFTRLEDDEAMFMPTHQEYAIRNEKTKILFFRKDSPKVASATA